MAALHIYVNPSWLAIIRHPTDISRSTNQPIIGDNKNRLKPPTRKGYDHDFTCQALFEPVKRVNSAMFPENQQAFDQLH